METAILSATHLSIGYFLRGKEPFSLHENLTFDLNRGEVTSLLGSNGAGKSTLLRTLSATQPALSGELKLLGRSLLSYSEQERSRLIGLVLTDRIMTGGLVVRELVALGRQPHTGFFGRLTRRDSQIVDEAIAAVGMRHKANCYVAELSDGERQKAMIAKVLAQECPVILLDEPTAFLDVTSRIETMILLRRIASEQQKTVLLSTHDLEQALLLSDRVWLLSPQKFWNGVPEDFVFSGVLENTFCRDEISFDRQNGLFRPIFTYKTNAFVRTGDLYFSWVRNLLERNGIGLAGRPEKANLVVEVVSPFRIVVSSCDRKGSKEFSSFSALTRYLQHIRR